MAHNDFENTIQGRFQGFESAPPEAVWTGINNLRNQRKKRAIIFWWILPLATAACLGIGIYWGFYGSSDRLNEINFNSKFQQFTSSKTEPLKSTKQRSIEPIDEKVSPNSLESNTADDVGSNQTQKIIHRNDYPSATSKYAKRNQPDAKSKGTDRSILPSILDSEGAITSKQTDQKLANNRLSLPSLTFLPLDPLKVSMPPVDLLMAYRFGNGWTSRQHSIGVRVGSFINISGVSASFENAPQPTLTNQAVEELASYSRFLEIAPYYQFTTTTARWSIQGHILYALSNISVSNSSANFPGQRHSAGMGIGTSYALINRRFSLDAYFNVQSEIGFNQFAANNDLTATGSVGGTPVAVNNPVGIGPSSYHQLMLAGEFGFHSSYVLNRANWAVTASAGYRNYFWQQEISSEAIIRTPSMLHLNAGLRFTF